MSATGTLISVGTFAAIYALLAIGLNIKFGTTGILDFGHVAYFLVGAYVTALITVPPSSEQPFQEYILGLNLPTELIEWVDATLGVSVPLLEGVGWLVAILIGMLAAGFVGLVVALPAIRLRADYLAIALLGVSVILQRIVQSPPRGATLVNGPDTLRGFSRPFNDLVPLPGDDLSAAVILGLVVVAVWLILIWLLAREDTIEPGGKTESLIVRLILVASTLGVGYLGLVRTRARRATVESRLGPQLFPRTYLPGAAAALAFGLVAAVGSLTGFGSEALMVTLGAASATTWVVIWIKARNHYRDYDRRSVALGLAITAGLAIAMAPAYLFGADGGVVGYVASFLTFGLLIGLGVGLYKMRRVMDEFDVPGDALGIIGLATLWLLAFRYFVISLRDVDTVDGGIDSTLQNVFWLLDFDAEVGFGLNYRRFLLILVVVALVLSYIMVQLVLHSPHGRALKAVRDDENVAMALGKNSFLFKVQAMVLGSAIGGLAGAMWAIQARALSYNMFHPRITFFVFLAVILGGKGNNKGVILGAGLYWVFVRATSDFAGYFPDEISSRITILRNAIIGLMIVAILYYRPEGIWKEEPPFFEVRRT
ncbi:MAG: branched-chain amino acid ABC transporter permease [Halobacteriota archaeon]